MNILCVLIPLIVGTICGILGYLLGSQNKNVATDDIDSIKVDLDNCNRMNSQLRTDLEKTRNQLINKEEQLNRISNSSSQNFYQTSKENVPTIVPFNSDAVKAVFGKKIKENDLKIIEGIGPKIEELFKTSGILTWKSLSETSVDRCKEMLMKAGDRFLMHDPGTWPRQAKLAYEGKWQELKDWQDILDGGKER